MDATPLVLSLLFTGSVTSSHAHQADSGYPYESPVAPQCLRSAKNSDDRYRENKGCRVGDVALKDAEHLRPFYES